MFQPKDTGWLNGYKNKTHIYVVYKRPTSDLGKHTDWKWADGKNIPCKWKLKKAGVAILISEKIDFKIKTITRDKEGYYIMIKELIQAEDITIVNIYALNIRAPQHIRQMLTAIKGEIDSNTNIPGDFNTRLLQMDRSSKMKINKETQALTDTLKKMDLIDIYRTFHPKTTEYTFFSSAHGTFSSIDHILGHKSSLGKL